MIKKLKVKNFKSLKDFEIEFGKFNVLVGRNNSGKSNIIDVLSFLNEGTKEEVYKIFAKRGGYKEVVFGGDTLKDIEINAIFEVEVQEGNLLFDYYIKFSGIKEIPQVIEEKLKVKRNNIEETFPKSASENRIGIFGVRWDIKNIPKSPSSKEEIRKAVETLEKSYFYFIGEIRKALETLEEKSYLLEDIIMANLLYTSFYSLLKNIHTYKVVPYIIKPQYPEVFVEEDIELDNDCRNLALFLLNQSQKNRKTFERIIELLSGVVEEIEDISPRVLGKNVYLMIKERNFYKYFYSDSISDGLISLLAYITIIETADENDVICFEEPENYIHARLLEFIFDLMKKSKAQIIVTTHSLSIIDLCNPEDIIIVEKKKGETKARRIKNPEELKTKLNEIGITLGDVYFSEEFKNE